MNSLDETQERALGAAGRLAPETVGTLEALGRVLAVDVLSDLDVPPFDTAAADGFALRSSDVAGADAEAPATLSVVESVLAGTVPTKAVGHGEAVRTRAGAPVSAGADAVVKGDRVDFEQADDGTGDLRVGRQVRPGQNVRRKGEDVGKGEIVLAEGETVSRAGAALLAAVGAASVAVYGLPRVGIISASDALVDLEQEPGPGEIRDSNSWALAAQTLQAGGVPTRLGTASYDEERMRELVRSADDFDVVVSSGGVGSEESDFVRRALDTAGSLELLEPAIRPGSPLLLGDLDGTLFFGLPGNPVGQLVAFELFVRPALRRMQGYRDVRRTEVMATLTHDVRKKPERTYFLCGRLESGGHISRTVTLTRGRGKGLLRSMHGSNCLVRFPAGETQFPTGTPVSCIRLDVAEGTP